MSSTKLQALVDELGAEPPSQFGVLGQKEVDALAEALRHAKRQQRKRVEQAAESALQHIPALLRPAVRKIIYG